MHYVLLSLIIICIGGFTFLIVTRNRSDWVLKNCLEYLDRIEVYVKRNNINVEEGLKFWRNLASSKKMFYKFWIKDLRKFAKDKELYDEFERIMK